MARTPRTGEKAEWERLRERARVLAFAVPAAGLIAFLVAFFVGGNSWGILALGVEVATIGVGLYFTFEALVRAYTLRLYHGLREGVKPPQPQEARQPPVATVPPPKPLLTTTPQPQPQLVRRPTETTTPQRGEPLLTRPPVRAIELPPPSPVEENAETKRCPYCGRELPYGDLHIICPFCGRALR